MRRIFLFAGYDNNMKVQDYVVYMVKKLAQLGDVYYLANGKMPSGELFKIAPYTRRLYTKEHSLRDFGSWHFLIKEIGWEKQAGYDEVIFCNDSVYGPFFDLRQIFSQMERRGYDFWSMTSDYTYKYHLHRYFMVFTKDVVKNSKFQAFWDNIKNCENLQNCEYELSELLAEQGFVGNSYIRSYKQNNVLKESDKLLSEYPVPFVKIKSFLPKNEYTAGSGFGLKCKIRLHTDYNTALINRHIATGHYPQTLGQRLVSFSGV